jgi:hypothetical protein
MTTWSKDELRRIADFDELHISPLREDGVTYGTPTWIWSVAVGDGLYVRPYYGQNSRWYQAAVRQKAGRIIAAGLTKEVIFEPVDGPINDLIDDAYRAKYRGSPYLSSMVSARAHSATVKGHAAGDQYRYRINDLFRREKFGHLPRALSKEGKPTHTYEVADIAYWSPGPDVAIFYRHDAQQIPEPGLIVIGKMDSGAETFNVPGSLKVTVELIK